MATEIGALHANLSASSTRFAADMGKARQALQTNAAKMSRAMDKVGSAFKSALGGMKRYAFFAGGIAVASFIALMKKSLDTAAAMGKLSQSLGVDIQQLSTLAHAANVSGIEIDDFADALQTLSENATDFSIGAGPAVEAFRALELNVKNANGTIKDSDVLLKEIADKFQKLENDSIKTTFAIQLFSDTGARLIPFLNQGAAGIQKLQDRAQELGLELDMKTATAAAEFNARITDLQANISGAGMKIATDLIPALNQMIVAMAEAWVSGDKLGTVLWKAFRAPGELKRTTEEYEKWAEIQRKMSGTKWEQLEVLPYKLVDVEGRKNEAKAMMLIARSAEENREKAAIAAGERRKQEQETLKALAAEREKESQALADRLSKIKSQEEAEAQKKAGAKAAIAAAENEAKAVIAAAENEAKARQQLGENTISTMQKEQDLFAETSRAQTVAWEIEQGNLSDLSTAHQDKILQLAQELDVLEALKNANEALTDTEKEAQQKAMQLMANRLTQQERYNKAVEELNTLFDTTELSVEAYNQELENLGKILETDLTRAIEDWGQRATDVMTDFAMTGKLSFRDFANSVIRDLIRMQIQQLLTQPLFAAIPALLGPATAPAKAPATIPGLAEGGPVQAQGLYEVAEHGPELLALGNRQFLLMAQQPGSITPLESAAIPDRAEEDAVRPNSLYEAAERNSEHLFLDKHQYLMTIQQRGSIAPLEAAPILGRAEGGPVQAQNMYEVNERGPEILTVGNRQFLMMAQQAGRISPPSETSKMPSESVSSSTAPQSVRIINVLDPDVISDWAASPSGERIIVNTINRNASQLKHLLT